MADTIQLAVGDINIRRMIARAVGDRLARVRRFDFNVQSILS